MTETRKGTDTSSLEKESIVATEHVVRDKEKQDDTIDFGGDSTLPPPPELTDAEEKRLYRKIDMRILPILSVMYLCSFLDRGNIGNAKLAGLVEELNLTGNKYNIALTMFFIPYCLAECPANLVLKRFRPSRWLPGITVVWGIIMTLMGLVKNYPQLIGVRICLGVAEAGLFPGVTYYLTFWYPRYMLQYRIGLFFSAATVAGAFSGLLAYAIEFMGGTRGIVTVAVGIAAFFIVVDFPSTASFLTPEERATLTDMCISRAPHSELDNSKLGEVEDFAWRYVWAAFKDWQVWLHIIIYMSVIAPLYGISLFLPSIISGFGYSTPVTQLLTVPPYIFATITLLFFGYFSDKMEKRSPFILLGLTMLLIGFSINISAASRSAKYFGTFFCVAGAYSAFPGVITWLGNNLAGQYKRGAGMALHIGIGNFSGAIASNIYRSQDSPRYILGHGLKLMFVGIGFICVPFAIFIYARINARRKAELERMGGTINLSATEIRELGDRAPDFKYSM